MDFSGSLSGPNLGFQGAPVSAQGSLQFGGAVSASEDVFGGPPTLTGVAQSGWVSYTYASQTPSLVQFTGVYNLVGASATLPVTLRLQTVGSNGDTADFSHPSQVGMILPSGVTYTSDSGVFLSALQAAGARFVPVTPWRIMDTRQGSGFSGSFGSPSITGGTSRSIPIPQSTCGIPNTAVAYSVNITVVPLARLSYLTIWPTGQTQPLASTLNSFDGRVVANAAVVPAGSGGSVSAFVSDTTDVIMDINGYFAPATTANSLAFYPLTPCRVVDTRPGQSATFGPPGLAANSSRTYALPSSSCTIPATAMAYSLNVTALPQSAKLVYLTTWPAGQPQPLASTLNSFDGSVVANAAIVPAGTGGGVSFFATDPTDLVVDINGYFAPAGSSGALSLYTVMPCRVVDTRPGQSATFGPPSLAGNTSRSFAVPTSSCSIPGTAQAYSMNVTVVPPGRLIYLTAWPTGEAQPLVSTLNSFLGKIVANAAIIPAGQNGAISVFASDPTDLILDINAYFAP
ncbi:MAG TPA: hypothetical protein VKU01_17735 [Bryobacteraceae bacterium]|nr:hypothetical protein [Bryobacteraceae bacterium]